MSLTYKQSVGFIVAKVDPNTATAVTDYILNPPIVETSTASTEDSQNRYTLPAGATNVNLGVGTLNLIRTLIVKPLDFDIILYLTTSFGLQQLQVTAGMTTVIHSQILSIVASNTSATLPATGTYVAIGD